MRSWFGLFLVLAPWVVMSGGFMLIFGWWGTIGIIASMLVAMFVTVAGFFVMSEDEYYRNKERIWEDGDL